MTAETRPQVSTRIEDGAGAVRVDDHFACDPNDLWAALTQPERLARWIAVVEGDLRLGGEFTARFTSGWEGPGRVEVCDRPHRLLTIMAPGTGEETVMEAVLTPEGGGVRLVIEERGLPLSELGFHAAGWQVHVEDLRAHLAGRPAEDWRTRWQQRLPEFTTGRADGDP